MIGHRRAVRFAMQYLPSGLSLDGLVLDIGANVGDFTAMIRQLEPRSRVIAVEPSARVRAKLSARFAADPCVRVEDYALSDKVGTATLNVAPDLSEMSSLLTPKALTTEPETVDTTTLDALVDEPVRLLKLDVQGHELAVLNGAAKVLDATDALLMEVIFESLYEGDTMFGSIDRVIRDAGFMLAGITEAHRYEERAVWADACYVKR